MTFPNAIWFMLIVCAILCAVGFYKFVYFLSVGYGFAVAGAGVFMLIYFRESVPVVVGLQCLVFLVYGIRLGGFLLARELKSLSYRKTLTAATKNEKTMPVFVKAAIWICVSILYVMQVSPVFYRLVNGDGAGTLSIVSLIIMICAVLLEATADQQKSNAKKQNPGRFCDSGLYKVVRCPNYLGEILFWTGVVLSGITTLDGAGQWIMALIGYIAIIYIMLSGAKRLEGRQDKNYGKDKAYQTYKKKTPILLPIIPLYSLSKCSWIKT